MGLTSIISNAINSVTSLLGGGTASLYIENGISNALQRIQGDNWNLDLGYSFEVEGGSLLGGGFKPFPLQINPSAIEQRENPNTNIIPVQTGVCVEYQGFIIKDLIISGTTGIQPFRSEAGTTQNVNFGFSKSLIPSGVPLFTGKWSGYMEMMLLRNYFRSYSEVKKSHSYKDLKLIFRNRKDNEHWYIEPVGAGVTVSRSASRPFLYDYSIELKIIGKASETPKLFGGPLGKILDKIQKVETFIGDIARTVSNVVAVVKGSKQFIKNFEKNLEITFIEPLDRIAAAFDSIKSGKSKTSPIPKRSYIDLNTTGRRIRDNMINWIDKGSDGYDETYGRIAIQPKRSFLIDDIQLLKAFYDLENCLNRILASDVLFINDAGDTNYGSTSSSDIDDAITLSSAEITESRIGSMSSLNNQFNGDYSFSSPSTISQYSIEYGETLERFTARVLGDPTRMNEIVILNNLDPPFVSEDSVDGKNTVKSGDLLFVPVNNSDLVTTEILRKNISIPITRGMTSVEKELGIDLRLTKDGDLAIDKNVPDLKLIAGINNAAQALGIAIGIERGDLLFHPNKGISSQIGRNENLTAGEVALELETTILDDKRFLAVNELYVKREANTIRLSAIVNIQNLNKPVPLKLDVSNTGT